MKINLTKKQYQTLIQALEAGNSVYGILGDCVSEKKYKKMSNKINELMDYFLTFAKDFGRKDLVEKFEGELILNDNFSKKFQEAMDEYDDEIFWNELEVRLGKRDFFRSITEAEKIELRKNNWFPERIHEIYEKWRKEFNENGLERLEIKKD